MKISEAIAGVMPIASATNQATERAGQNGFDRFLADVSRRHSRTNPSTPETRGREDSRPRLSERTVTDRMERPVLAARRRPNEHDSASEASAAQAQSASETPVTDTPQSEAPVNEEQAMSKITEILQIPAEIIAEWMEQLGLTAQDLVDPQAVAKLLKVALGVETPSELITDPEFPELFKEINEAIVELTAEAETKVSVGQTAAKAAGTQAVPADDLKGLEVLNENGQLIVADEAAEEEAQVSSARPQETRAATTQTSTPQTSAPAQQTQVNLPHAEEAVQDAPQNVDTMLNMTTTKAKIENIVLQATTPTQSVNTADVIEQIMSQVRVVNLGGQFTEMRMTLRPESLGDIVLRVLTQNGIVIAQFEAESQRVKEALEANFNMLRDALEEQGIRFSELSVSVRDNENERMGQFERGRQSIRRRMAEINGEGMLEEQQTLSDHNGFIDIQA